MIMTALKITKSGVEQVVATRLSNISNLKDSFVAYLENGAVKVEYGYENLATKTFKMNENFIGDGTDEIFDNDVVEFTIHKNDKFVDYILLRNSDGISRKIIFISLYSLKAIWGEKQSNIIKVVNGRAIKQSGYYVKDGKAMPLMGNNVYEIYEDGSQATICDEDVGVVKKFAGYSINSNNDLLYEGNIILSNVADITKAIGSNNGAIWGLENHANRDNVKNRLSSFGMSADYINGYESFINSVDAPVCGGWVGSGDSTSSIIYESPSLCRKLLLPQALNVLNLPESIIALTLDGEYKKVEGNTITDIPTAGDDADGFNKINFQNNALFNHDATKTKFAQNEGITTTMLFKRKPTTV